MRISDQNQLRFGVVLSYAQMGLSVVLHLLYTPFVLNKLGQGEYGLLQTALSTVAMLSVLSLGFNSSYIRYYARYKKEGDQQAIYKLNGLFLILFCVLGLVVLAFGVALSFNLELVFRDGLTAAEYETARVLLLITTINLALTFPRSVFANIISAHERYVFFKVVGIVETVIAPVVNFPILLLGFRSVAITVVSLAAVMLTFVLYAGYTFRVLRQKFVFRNFQKGLMGSLCRFTGFILINLLVDQVNNQIDKVLLARFCGTAVVAVYTVGANFSSYYTQFSTAISGIFTPRVHQLVLSTNHDQALQRRELTAFFTKVGRLQYLLLALVMSGFAFFGQAFLNLWVGPGYTESYYVALVCMLPATVPLIQNVGIEIQRAENRHHYRSYIYGAVALANLISSIYLCQIWGAVGAAIGTGAACVLGNILIMDIVYHKKINIDMVVFWKNIGAQTAGMLVPFAAGFLMMRYAPMDSYGALVGFIALYAALYGAFVWRFSMNQQEKGWLLAIVRKLRRGKGAAS